MKLPALLLAALVAASLSSCASFQLDSSQARPAASIATAAYLQQVPKEDLPEALANLRAAATKVQMVALTEDPTAEALAIALSAVDADPGYSAMAAALVRLYRPKVDHLSTPEAQAALVALSEGIFDTVVTYERATSNK